MKNKLSLLVNFVGVDKMSGALRNIVGLGRKGSSSLSQLRGEGRKLEAQLREVRREIDGASGNVTKLIDRERELERAIERTNSDIEKRKKLYAIDGDRRAMEARGEAMKGRGKENMAAGAGLLAPLVLAGKAAMDFDKTMLLLGQKMDMTEEKTDSMAMALLKVADAAKQMPDTIVSGADFLASKGLGEKQILAMMPAIGRFGTAWDADVTDTAKAALAAHTSLGIGLGQTSRSLEVMAAAGKAGGFEVRDMAQYFPVLASSMKTLGAEGIGAVGDLSAALQVLELKTGDGAQAATNLKNLMSYPMTARGIANFKKFGVDVPAELKKAEAEGRSPLEALIELTERATGGDEMKISELWSNQQAAEGMRALVQERERYLEIRRQSLASAGLTEKEFARMAKGSSANWTKLKGTVSRLAIVFGDKLLPTINSGFESISRIVNAVGNWAQKNPETAATLMKLVGGLALFRVGLGATQFLLGGMLGPLAKGIALYRQYRIVGSVAALFPNLAMGVKAVGIAFRFMLGPVGLAITIIGILGYAIYRNWDTIKATFNAGLAWLSGAWATFKGYFWSAVTWLLGLHAKFTSIGRNLIDGLVRGILAAPGKVWNALKSVVMGGIDRVKNWLGIKSPSRVFMQIGGHTATGLALGIERARRKPLSAMGRLATGLAAAGSIAVAPAAARVPDGGAGGQARSSAAGQSGLQVTLNIYQQPGEDAQAFADRVMRLLEDKARIGARSSYEDDD